jgi:hypothetical protein
MPEFESWNQYWEFSHFIMRKARHILDARQRRFLDVVIATGAKRKGTIEKGTVLWRAQFDNDLRKQVLRDADGNEADSFDVEYPCKVERMKPLPYRACEGRVNPKGIPCLYLSDDRDTAMTETRPWIGSSVSVGQFVILRDLNVVDCTGDRKQGSWISLHDPYKQPDPAIREEYVWGAINRAFSTPVTRNDDVAEYAPTQVLAEAFQSAGYDGIVYGSRLGKGRTIAIFDLTAADLANCELFRVEELLLKYVSTGESYYVHRYYEEGIQKEATVSGREPAGFLEEEEDTGED